MVTSIVTSIDQRPVMVKQIKKKATPKTAVKKAVVKKATTVKKTVVKSPKAKATAKPKPKATPRPKAKAKAKPKTKAQAKPDTKASPNKKVATAKDLFAEPFNPPPMEGFNKDELIIEGLRQNNLKNIDVTIPHNKITVLCGPSGSGKSSLAFDTLFAEGHWRFMESLSTYTRMFLERMDRPELDNIRNIRPAIAIEQKNPVRTSRSTVGTATEINDYLRLLFARAGEVHCPKCNKIVRPSDPITVAEELLKNSPDKRALIGFDIPIKDKGHEEVERILTGLIERGFIRIVTGESGETVDISIDLDAVLPSLTGTDKISVVVDRVVLKEDARSRITDSLETSLKEGAAVGWAVTLGDNETGRLSFSSALTCTDCEIPLERPRPILFSFNHPLGACDECKGFGNILRYDETKIIPDKTLSLKEGAIEPWTKPAYTWWYEELERFGARYDIDLDAPFEELSARERKIVYEGTKDFDGIDGFFKELETKKYKLHIRVFLSRFKGQFKCKACGGTRFKEKALNIRIGGVNIAELSAMTIEDAKEFFTDLKLDKKEEELTKEPLRQIRLKLRFLDQTGLGYITLNRLTRTLSGGEAQRIQLANQLGSSLTGVLYILDEPSVGLHPRDVSVLIEELKQLKARDNTVVLVEHDSAVIEASDHVVELGPGSGELGGRLVYAGPTKELLTNGTTLSAEYLRGIKSIHIPHWRRRGNGEFLTIKGARGNNLKSVDLSIPLGTLSCITGVSGSGKSTLIMDTLYNALAHRFGIKAARTLDYDSIEGVRYIRDVRLIDQGPIGKTPRSNPITYIGGFDEIRSFYASLKEATTMGLTAGSFSFNVPGGRCEECAGEGAKKLEMYFLPDVYTKCPACNGKRYRPQILEIRCMGKNIHDILNMTFDEAYSFFSPLPALARRISILREVGLGYLKLGQAATTLSGGEAQRLKIARELTPEHSKGRSANLSKLKGGQLRAKETGKEPGQRLYILDEPTTGLHTDDIKKLLSVLNRLVDSGNTIIVVEHNLELIKTADFIADIGPEGGIRGGEIIATGTPEDIVAVKTSHTGHYLKKLI